MSARPTLDELFDRRAEYPDPDARARLARLVGLDDFKLRLTKMLAMLIHPAGLEAWASPGADRPGQGTPAFDCAQR